MTIDDDNRNIFQYQRHRLLDFYLVFHEDKALDPRRLGWRGN